MPSQIFSIVEVEANDDSYVIINGRWWKKMSDPGSPGNDSQELGIADDGHDAEEYVWTVDACKMSDVDIESYRLKVTMVHKNVTDYVERDIAQYVLLEQYYGLLEFERFD